MLVASVRARPNLGRSKDACDTHSHFATMHIRSVKHMATLVFAALLGVTATAQAGTPPFVDVAIRTTDGTIVVRLDTKRAPITSANFLHYVDSKAYDHDATFYRTVSKGNEPQVPFEVIQGGLKMPPPSFLPITLEPTSTTTLHNDDGEIAMARTNDPNSATTEFFICVGNARYLDAGGPLGPGYAAFGKVVRGMDVVHRIHHAPAQREALAPPIAILSMKRVR
jgi:peptidyl-prolyl cis-trans isomerase A (cyclophilin A)